MNILTYSIKCKIGNFNYDDKNENNQNNELLKNNKIDINLSNLEETYIEKDKIKIRNNNIYRTYINRINKRFYEFK